MDYPNTYTKVNETGCCAVPDINNWDEKEITLNHQRFIRMHTKSFLFVPLNMSKVMTTLQKLAIDSNATMPPEKAIILSRDLSPWKAEQLYAVSKPIDSADNVELNANYLTKVFEGPYSDAKKWYKTMLSYAESINKTVNKIYFFYTTCPKCAKHYGKNYTFGLAEA